jgi:protein-tyrosine-phosphatase
MSNGSVNSSVAEMPKKVLCVCKGNSDRSPMMAAVLAMYIANAGKGQVVVESAGILEVADQGKAASPILLTAGKRIGIDFSDHRSTWIEKLDLAQYDLVVVVDDDVAARVMELGVPYSQVCNAVVPNPWPCHFQDDYQGTAERIMSAMYHVVTRYFSEN